MSLIFLGGAMAQFREVRLGAAAAKCNAAHEWELQVAVQGIDTADFLHLLADCQLLTNR